MNAKKEQLLKILQRSSRPITGKELAKQLDVSTRTIINYIKEFNNDSKEAFILSGQDGYFINREVDIDLQEDDIPQDRMQRMFYLLRLLLLSGEEGIDTFDLADEMYISYSLLKKEIADFNRTMKSYDVNIVSRNNIIYIEGSESAKRRLMTAFIRKNQNENILNDEKLRSYFSEEIVDRINEILRSDIHNAGAYINEFSRLNLLLHLSIITNRLMIGEEIENVNNEKRKIENQSQSLADHIISDVERSFNIELNNSEYLQMSSLIQSHIHLDNYETGTVSSIDDSDLYALVSETMDEVRNRYYLDLTNENFLVPFSLHIENLLMRLKKNILIDNPIKESFRNSSPFLYDVAIFIIEHIKEELDVKENVSDDELTFLVMHLALELERQKKESSNVNCLLYFPKYLGMEKDLVNKIRLHFEDMIKIVAVIHTQEEMDNHDYDILISFVNVEVPVNKKYIRISPLLTQNDYALMNDAITSMQQEKLLMNFANVFPFFFKEENFEIIGEDMDKYAAISRMCQRLKDNGYVEDEFEQQVIQREEAISTGYINFAVPHGVSAEVSDQTVAVLIAPNGIVWSDKIIYCVMLMAVDPERLEEFQNMYNALLLLLMETDCVEKLRSISDFNQFRRIMTLQRLS